MGPSSRAWPQAFHPFVQKGHKGRRRTKTTSVMSVFAQRSVHPASNREAVLDFVVERHCRSGVAASSVMLLTNSPRKPSNWPRDGLLPQMVSARREKQRHVHYHNRTNQLACDWPHAARTSL